MAGAMRRKAEPSLVWQIPQTDICVQKIPMPLYHAHQRAMFVPVCFAAATEATPLLIPYITSVQFLKTDGNDLKALAIFGGGF